MKSVGIVRRIDNLGRINIPKELTKRFNIKDGDPMEVLVDEDKIILRKYKSRCTFCGSTDNIISYQNKIICSICINDIKEKV